MKTAEVIYDKNYVIGDVDRRLFGSFVEHVGNCLYGGIYEPEHRSADKNGFRNDVKELISRLGVTAIRYPGGNFVSGYNWKDGVGPKEQRPVRKELAWNATETNQVGTNEFAALMRELNLDLIMSVNLGTGTPKEAAELIEYCNIPKGTYWSDKRREHGMPEPHNIKTWCLGNEMDSQLEICAHTPGEYARLCKETAKMMHWVDPDAQFIACGSCTNEEGNKTYGLWDRVVLEECYNYIDYISLHRYYSYSSKNQVSSSGDTAADIPFFFKDLQNYLDTITSLCDFVKGEKRSDKTVCISFDEWGLLSDMESFPAEIRPDYKDRLEYKYSSYSETDAMIFGGILCTFLNNADRVKIACQSILVNAGGMITSDPAGNAFRQATYYPFQDAARFARGEALQASAILPEAETDHHGKQKSMTIACTYDKETGEIAVFAANCNMSEDIFLTLRLQSFENLSSIEWREIYCEDPYLKNTFENEFNVVPHKKELPDPLNGEITVTIKKHSWNVFRFRSR